MLERTMMTAASRMDRIVPAAAPQFRRVIPVEPPRRSAGRLTTGIAAALIFLLTALCYLWQDSLAVSAGLKVPFLTARLQSEQNTTAQLESEIAHLTSFGVVTSAASLYGYRWPATGGRLDNTQVVTVPGGTIVRRVAISSGRPGSHLQVSMHIDPLNPVISPLWAAIWSGLRHAHL